jgi:predicted DNA-binding protein (UPF0251 family)
VPRPKLYRTIQSPPAIDGFSPSGAGQGGEVVLSFEEFEAVRLIDFAGLDQSQAADQMGVSRQTFGRVLRSARFIVAKALVLGFRLKVTGGCYQVLGHGHRSGNGQGRCRRRHGGINSMEQERESTGGTHMAENNKPFQEQDTTNNSNAKPGTSPDQGPGQSQDQGKGQGQRRGQGRGGGMGRGKGGGKGDGSCRRS